MAGKPFAARRKEAAEEDSPGREALLARLAGEISRIEERPVALGAGEDRPLLALGVKPIDEGLARGRIEAAGLHEVRTAATMDAAAGTGFALALAARAAPQAACLFWISVAMARGEAGRPYGPGLAALGFAGTLVRVEVDRVQDALWAAEEVAATPEAGACLLELRGNPAAAGLAFSRRIALRARACRMPVVLLRQAGAQEAGAAQTRWLAAPAPSRTPAGMAGGGWVGPPAFSVKLEKCRAARPGEWTLEWNDDERVFALAEAGGDRLPGGNPVGRRSPLSVGQPAETGDGPDPAHPPRAIVAARRAS